jgi:hypothetical protein
LKDHSKGSHEDTQLGFYQNSKGVGVGMLKQGLKLLSQEKVQKGQSCHFHIVADFDWSISLTI